MDIDRPSTWKKFHQNLCQGCWAGCCMMPVEIKLSDLVRMELAMEGESPKEVAKRLQKQKIIKNYRAATGLFMLEQVRERDCLFLGKKDRLCTIYEKRPEVCRKFPEIGPRPGFCPAARTKPSSL